MIKTIYQKCSLLLLIFFVGILSEQAWAQATYQVSGTVLDELNSPLPGVNIIKKGINKGGVISDLDGNFTIKNLSGKTVLMFSYMGYIKKEVTVTPGTSDIKVSLVPDASNLDEVVVVGMGTQRKVSVVGAISNVKPSELNAPSTSVTNMLAGVVPGIIAVERTGEPGQDVSEFWIRGISTFGANASALVLIDGIEGNLNDLDPADIESFSILKDASATAVYGVRGANGVVIVTTKSGQEGKTKITWRSSVSLSYSPRLPEYLRAYDYAKLANEARAVTGMKPLYDSTEMEIIKNQLDPELYPDVNWQEEILKDFTYNHQHYLNVSGGGKIARYFISMGATFKDAVFKQDKINKYNTNVNWGKYNFRAKVDVNVTSSTVLGLSIDGTIVDEQAPGWGNNGQLWGSQVNLTPLAVPVRYKDGTLPAYGTDGWLISPYILLNMTGYKKTNRSTMNVNMNLQQNFGKWIKGLSARGMFSYFNNNVHTTIRKKQPNAYKASGRYNDGSLMLQRTIVEQPLSFETTASANRRYYFESQLNYNRVFNEDHRVGALLNYYMQTAEKTDVDNEIAAIPERYQALAGRITYSFQDTYLIEGNIGYTGSENFAPGKQFGIFPSIAAGWVLTNYEFMRKNVKFLNNLKLRLSYGEVGNDRIGGRRFPYQTLVNANSVPGTWGYGGVTEGQIGADNLHWEVAKKYNLGIDFELFKGKIGGTVDIFRDTRDNIFQERVMIPVETGLVTNPFTNVGRMRSSGVDGNIFWNQKINKKNSFTIRANMTYATNKVVHWDENILKYPYLYKSGYSHNSLRGLIAMGLFKDQEEIKSSPKQNYGEARPGDIRYKDVNGDGVINDDDKVIIGRSNVPEIQFGLALEYKYKNWTFSTLFNGSANTNVFMGGSGYYPFINGATGNILTIVNDQKNRWTPAWYSGDPSTENPNATFPRMTYGPGSAGGNNYQRSTFWMRNGSFIRWQNLDISYRFDSNKYFEKVGLTNVTLQFVGRNLGTLDNIKIWDPAQVGGNGVEYPIQRTFSFQLTANF